MKIKRRHIKMAQIAMRMLTPTSVNWRVIARWHRAAKGKHQ